MPTRSHSGSDATVSKQTNTVFCCTLLGIQLETRTKKTCIETRTRPTLSQRPWRSRKGTCGPLCIYIIFCHDLNDRRRERIRAFRTNCVIGWNLYRLDAVYANGELMIIWWEAARLSLGGFIWTILVYWVNTASSLEKFYVVYVIKQINLKTICHLTLAS